MKNQRILITFLGMLYFITVTSGSVGDFDSLVNNDFMDFQQTEEPDMEENGHSDVEILGHSDMEILGHSDLEVNGHSDVEVLGHSDSAVKKPEVNGANGISTIGEILKAIRAGFAINTTVTNTSERIPYHTSLAAQYGTLTSESVRTMDRKLKVMIAGTNRMMKRLQQMEEYKDKEIPFREYLGVMNQNVFIKEKEGSKKRNSDYLIFEETNWFKFDGSPEDPKVYQVKSWFANLIDDSNVLADTEINITDFANIVAASGAAVKDFLSFFMADEYVERSVVDVGVLRYPDITKPYFQLFRIKLRAYRRCVRIMATQQDESGIKGDYDTVSFVPRRKFMRKIRKETMDQAVTEAENMFNF